MAKKTTVSEYPLVIEVTKTFPLHRIKEVYVKRPEASYGETVKLTRDESVYLLDSLKDILEDEVKKIAWVELDASNTPHLMIGSSSASVHDPKFCPECIEPGTLSKETGK